MRQFAVLTVALLLVLAGCNGAPGGGTTVDTETTTDQTLWETTTESDRPPGLSASGVPDAEALAEAHVDALAGQSYTHHREVQIAAANGTELGGWSQRTQVGADRLAFNHTQTATGATLGGLELSDFRTYTDGSTTLTNASVYRDGYHREDGRGFAEGQFDGQRLLARALDAAETSVETVERDGETWYRVRAQNGSETVATQGPNATVEVEATNVTATALVAPSGLVANVTYGYDFERGGVSGHWTMTARYSTVGETTVERPDWVADARERFANRLAPGLNETGVTDPATLADAHASVLDNTSYTVESDRTASENGTVLARSNSTAKVAAGGVPTVTKYDVSEDGEPRAVGFAANDTEAWTDENGTLYARESPNGTTDYRASGEARSPLRSPTDRDRLYLLFVGLNATVTETETDTETETETRDGTARYRVNSTGVADADVLASALHVEAVRNASLTAVVTEEGHVSSYRIEYTGRVGDRTVRIQRTVRFAALGETAVERPPWYDEAVNATEERA